MLWRLKEAFITVAGRRYGTTQLATSTTSAALRKRPRKRGPQVIFSHVLELWRCPLEQNQIELGPWGTGLPRASIAPPASTEAVLEVLGVADVLCWLF